MISDLTEARFKGDSETAALAILWTDTIGFSITAKLIDIHSQAMYDDNRRDECFSWRPSKKVCSLEVDSFIFVYFHCLFTRAEI